MFLGFARKGGLNASLWRTRYIHQWCAVDSFFKMPSDLTTNENLTDKVKDWCVPFEVESVTFLLRKEIRVKKYICPVCHIQLGSLQSGPHITSQCHVCSGIFLPYEQLQNQFKQNATVFGVGVKASEQERRCPADQEHMIEKKITDNNRSVLIDQCPKCSGVWFDKGEIRQANKILRKMYGRFGYKKQAERILQKAEHDSEHDQQAPKALEADWWFSVLTTLPVEGYNKVFRTPMVTIVLIVLSCIGFGAGMMGPSLFDLYALSSKTVFENPVNLISSMFLQAGTVPFLVSLYFMKTFGDNVEDRLGRVVYLIFYLFCGVFAGMCHVKFAPPDSVFVGASGAVSGILGAYIILFPKVKIFLIPNVFSRFQLMPFSVAVYIPIWFVLQFILSLFSIASTPWFALVGGTFCGVALAFIMNMVISDARLRFLKEER